MKTATRSEELSRRTHGQPITFLSLFSREEILSLLLPLALIALYWLMGAISVRIPR